MKIVCPKCNKLSAFNSELCLSCKKLLKPEEFLVFQKQIFSQEIPVYMITRQNLSIITKKGIDDFIIDYLNLELNKKMNEDEFELFLSKIQIPYNDKNFIIKVTKQINPFISYTAVIVIFLILGIFTYYPRKEKSYSQQDQENREMLLKQVEKQFREKGYK